jgi:hypothetical protein
MEIKGQVQNRDLQADGLIDGNLNIGRRDEVIWNDSRR